MPNPNPYAPPESEDSFGSQQRPVNASIGKWWHFKKRPAHESLAVLGMMSGIPAAYYWKSSIGLMMAESTLAELKSRHYHLAVGHTILSVALLIIAAVYFMRRMRQRKL